MRHESDNPGVAAFTSNCTGAGQLLRNQGGIEPLALQLRKPCLCQLDNGSWLVLTRFTFKLSVLAEVSAQIAGNPFHSSHSNSNPGPQMYQKLKVRFLHKLPVLATQILATQIPVQVLKCIRSLAA